MDKKILPLAQTSRELTGSNSDLRLGSSVGAHGLADSLMDVRSLSATSSLEEVNAASMQTRRLDVEAVLSGNRKPDYLHFIPPSMARTAKIRFPENYRKG
ncbi:hypothetical protein VDR63_20270 [Xanthomonas campestris pv. campestris]|nr:hypothetical protein [Xanthomonas campestris pv. campestris]